MARGTECVVCLHGAYTVRRIPELVPEGPQDDSTKAVSLAPSLRATNHLGTTAVVKSPRGCQTG